METIANRAEKLYVSKQLHRWQIKKSRSGYKQLIINKFVLLDISGKIITLSQFYFNEQQAQIPEKIVEKQAG